MSNQPDEKLYKGTPHGDSICYRLKNPKQDEKKHPTEINYQYGRKVSEIWCQNGIIKRDNDEPSFISYSYNPEKRDLTPIMIEEKWMIGDKITRGNDKPARIWYYGDGKKEHEFWMVNGKYHREGDLPADIYYDKNGVIKHEIWMKNHVFHREPTSELKDPAVWIDYYEDGKISGMKWYKNGELHRDNGFAIIYCDEKADSHGQNYINGIHQGTAKIDDITTMADYIAHVEAGVNYDWT